MITGVSSGIGAVHADRFARRGHPVILVASDLGRLDEVAARLSARTSARAELPRADLTDPADLAHLRCSRRTSVRRLGSPVRSCLDHGPVRTLIVAKYATELIRWDPALPTRLPVSTEQCRCASLG
jgi:NAD(P)-dependent dehydrogenase (short-subunit alcohol dehydrogenase family)